MPSLGDFTVDRNNAKYVLGSSGTLVAVPADEPAFEFNPDGSYKGLLVEPAATNLATYSDDFNSVGWSLLDGNSQVTSDAAVSPDGTTNADKLEASNTSSVQKILRKTYSSSGENTFSIYAKAAELSYLHIDFSDIRSAIFDITAGSGSVVSSTGSTYASIEDVGNGWYRCIVTTTLNSTFIDVQLYNGTTITFSASIGDGVYIWGAQLEAGPIATSYIPTSGSTVQRVKDDINLSPAASLIGQNEGTLYVEVDWRLATGTGQYLLSANDVVGNNRIAIYNQNSPVNLQMLAVANNVTLTNQGESSTAYSGIQKIAFAYKTNDFELYRNGSSISSDTTGGLAALATLPNIDLGQNYGALGQANMWIRAFALYRKRLSDSECEALTTL